MIMMNTIDKTWRAFYDKMNACKAVYGYFTANIEGNPVVAYIEHVESAEDNYYIVKHPELFDTYLFDEGELYDYLNKHTYGWTFHPGKEAA